MSLPYYCTKCYSVLVNGVCPECSQEPTTTSGTTTAPSATAETPRTDYAFDGDNSVGTPPTVTTWAQAKEWSQQLERDLAATRQRLSAAMQIIEDYIMKSSEFHEDRDRNVAHKIALAKLEEALNQQEASKL